MGGQQPPRGVAQVHGGRGGPLGGGAEPVGAAGDHLGARPPLPVVAGQPGPAGHDGAEHHGVFEGRAGPLPGQGGPAADRPAHPEGVQRAQRVGPQGQARAGLGERGRALEDLHLPATPGQRQRAGQPGDPAADDDRFHGVVPSWC
jgi:hypothetical protein